MNYTEGQFLYLFAQLLRDHAELVSGAFTDNQSQRACGTNDDGTFQWRDATDWEKRSTVLNRMQRRLEFMSECMEHFPTAKKED